MQVSSRIPTPSLKHLRMTYKPAIVVIAYNRPRALERLLSSLERAEYPVQDIALIISIDRDQKNIAANEEVLRLAEGFQWKQGEKKVVFQQQNLGLRQHVLTCGDYTEAYGSAILLEDDLMVSPLFYSFTREALAFSENTASIAGISLYNHRLNVHTREDFSALEDGYDNWYFQFASSWGQAWSHAQWKAFRDWYDAGNQNLTGHEIPANVKAWSEKSWLKYFIGYLIEKDLFFLYPRISHTTNFSDQGTHVGSDSTAFQVPLSYGHQRSYSFSKLDTSMAVYDAFYESRCLSGHLDLDSGDLITDLYGYRKGPWQGRYLLSSRAHPYKVLRSFGRCTRPHETNIMESVEGSELYLYDTTVAAAAPEKPDEIRRILFSIRHLNSRQIARLRKWSIHKRMMYLKRRIFRSR